MSELITYHAEDGIATLTLNNGKVNAISPDVIDAFNAALDRALAHAAKILDVAHARSFQSCCICDSSTAAPALAVDVSWRWPRWS